MGLFRIHLVRKFHNWSPKTENRKKVKKILSYINNYDETTSSAKNKNKYLNLLRNIYNTIPSRINEKELWMDCLNNLKTEKPFIKLKKIVKHNKIACDVFICRQIIFLCYIGLDEEATLLLNELERKLEKCRESNFQGCTKHVKEDTNDIIKMLYVLYHFRSRKKNFKNVFILLDRFIYNKKELPASDIKYLFYFHLFYFDMDYSLIRIKEYLETQRHLLPTEQLMLLIRYLNIYLKYLYLNNVIKHRSEELYVPGPTEGTQFNWLENKGEKEICTNKIATTINRNEIDLRNVSKEIDIFLNNLFRINKNEKDYFTFTNFEDIEIKNKHVKNKKQEINDDIYVFLDDHIKPGDNISFEKRYEEYENETSDRSVSRWEKIESNEKKKKEERETKGEAETVWKDDVNTETAVLDAVFSFSKSRTILRKEELEISDTKLELYRSIYDMCVKEILKNVLISKEKINPEIIWKNFFSNFFKDEYIFFLFNELKSNTKLVREEEYIIFLKQSKLLKLYESSYFFNISSLFFKNYINEERFFKNMMFSDKLTYYTDMFCYNSYLQKYILYIYKRNFNNLTIKILKKILCKLYFCLLQNRPLVNGFDKLTKSIIGRLLSNGSMSDVISVIYVIRQFQFFQRNSFIGDGVKYVKEAEVENKSKVLKNSVFGLNFFEKDNRKVTYNEIENRISDLLSVNDIRDFTNVPSNFTLFHLPDSILFHLKKDFFKVQEFVFYRTIIEKRRNRSSLAISSKYLNKSLITMLNKQLVKLFCVFFYTVYESVRTKEKEVHLFECINNYYNENKIYQFRRKERKWNSPNSSEDNILKKNVSENHTSEDHISEVHIPKKNTSEDHISKSNNFPEYETERTKKEEGTKETADQMAKKVKEEKEEREEKEEKEEMIWKSENRSSMYDSLFFKEGVDTELIDSYEFMKHRKEYQHLQRFQHFITFLIIDNFIYFDLKNCYFIKFLFALFQKKLLFSFSVYHYFFFYYIFRDLTYQQINQKERKEFFISEQQFQKNKADIIRICDEQIKSSIRRYIQDCLEPKKSIEIKDQTEQKTENVTQKRNMCAKETTPILKKEIIQYIHFDCLIYLILYYLKTEEIEDIFKNCFLLTFNKYLKDKGAYLTYKNEVLKNRDTNTNKNTNKNTSQCTMINCFDCEQIKSFFCYDNDKNEKSEKENKIHEQSNKCQKRVENILNSYSLICLNMNDNRLREAYEENDFEFYVTHLLQNKKKYEAAEILKICKWKYKYKKEEQIEQLINKITASLNTYTELEFFISYLFLVTLHNMKSHNIISCIIEKINNKIGRKENEGTTDRTNSEKETGIGMGIRTEIGTEIGIRNEINFFWQLLLCQIIYLIKIKYFYFSDFLFMRYKHVVEFYKNFLFFIENRRKTDIYFSDENKDDVYKLHILHFLRKRDIYFLTNVKLKGGPFLLDIFIPSKNISFINKKRYLFSDVFLESLKCDLFVPMNSVVLEMNQKNVSMLQDIFGS